MVSHTDNKAAWALADTSVLQYNPCRTILVLLNQPLAAKVVTGKPLVYTHTAYALWHAKEFSFAIHFVWIWFPISLSAMPAAEKLVWVMVSTVLGTSIISFLLSKNYKPKVGNLGSPYNHKKSRKAKLSILSPSEIKLQLGLQFSWSRLIFLE